MSGVLPLFAVHISDGVLRWPWLLGGFVVAALLVGLAARRIPDEEIPRVGLLTAAFFVASLLRIHVGPTSVHLLLNGLVGVVLGPRAALAILVGLFLQAFLLSHGGFLVLGVNACVLTLPALLARPLYQRLRHSPRSVWLGLREGALAVGWLLHPVVLAALALLALAAMWLDRRLATDDAFRAGLVTGFVVAVLTALLNAVALVVAGVEDWRVVAVLVLAAHLPVAAIEGLIVGFAASFLERVKPEMVGS